jgi:GTP-binding protein EngB required for normal cell division
MIALAFGRARYRLMRAGTGAMVSGTVSTALDEAFISQLVDHRLPFCLLLTKTDTLSGNKIAQRKAQIRRFIKAEHIDVPMIMTSAVTGLGLDETRALIHDFITDKYQLSQSDL